MSQTPLTLDLNYATKEQVGAAGLSRAELDQLAPSVELAHDALAHAHEAGTLEFLKLPFDGAAARAARELATSLRGRFDTLVVLGIGGSSLGAKALFAGLSHPFHNLLPASKRQGLRLFFPDNSDPSTFAALLDVLDLEKTAFAAITKSGGTAETWAQVLALVERLGPARAREHFVAVTDPKRGALRAVATAEGWPTLPVPPAVGGRFSVLTAVGLLPTAAAGLDTEALLAGAGAMVRRCASPKLFENPAALLASALYAFDTAHGRPLHLLMPYADALRETGDWFVQLWAESLGKKKGDGFVGPTPLRAVGATDQHSLLQLLMEGPQNKVTVFVAIDEPRVDLPIPRHFEAQPDVGYLGGHTFHGLLTAEQRATAAALAANGRPSITLRLPKLNAFALGELMMLLEIATGLAGGLYGIDAYDQPGVEAGKRYTCGLLGRPGYEAAKQELDARPRPDPRWVLGAR
jgi:glucose-6-phosphate isomerase